MTPQMQQDKLSEAYDLLTEAHDLILDIYLSRKESGEIIERDAISSSRKKIRDAVDSIRNTGEVKGYFPDWEKPD